MSVDLIREKKIVSLQITDYTQIYVREPTEFKFT